MNSTCIYCLDDNDLFVAFTTHKVCGKCAKKQHRLAVQGKSPMKPKIVIPTKVG